MANPPEIFRISASEADQRLDRYLVQKLSLSRKRVKALLDRGKIFINGHKVVIASWEVNQGDKLQVFSERSEEDPSQTKPQFLKVAYEDSDLLIVEKDAGIPCEKSPVAWRPSMVAMVNQYLKKTHPHLPAHYVGLVHRLDTDTSGLLIYTKTKEANKITEQFKKRTVVRKYLALVEGRVEGEKKVLEGYLAQANLPGGKKIKLVPKGKGKRAVTTYTVLERYGKATLLEISIKTGRTHQIRVQLAAIRHPILGDRIYGSTASRDGSSFKRQALHANTLCFRHPVTGKKIELISEPPRDFRRLIDRLREGWSTQGRFAQG
ncbi:MAG: RluA family pseudouridine synthase [Deltaproteobacteria bacterium]|nr:RluA family pseudouridine synthase [Deltaproteobacteria bacterium]